MFSKDHLVTRVDKPLGIRAKCVVCFLGVFWTRSKWVTSSVILTSRCY